MKLNSIKTLALVLALALILLTACLTLFQTKTYLPYMNLLNQSIEYDMNHGKLSLTIPEGLPAAYSFYILIAGRVKAGEAAMSIHLFDKESASSSWVAGKTYSHLFQNDSFLSATILTAIKVNQTGEILADSERTTDIFIDGNGELSISVHVPIADPESTQESAPSVAVEKLAQKSTPQPESIDFFGETYFLSDDNVALYGEDNYFASYQDIGFIGIADENGKPVYQQVKAGQVIGGVTVADGTFMGFDLIGGKWELTESHVYINGPIEFTGELERIPYDAPLWAGGITFTPTSSKSGFLPFIYGYDSAPATFFMHGDLQEKVSDLLGENESVTVSVTFDNFRLLKTDRMSQINYAELIDIELYADFQ